MMEYTKDVDGTIVTIRLEGNLDTETAPRFGDELFPTLDNVSSLVLDFSDLEYVSSAGLRVLLKLKKKMMSLNADMDIVNINEGVMSVLELSGFDMILNIK